MLRWQRGFHLYQSAHLNCYDVTLCPKGGEHEASGIHRGVGGRGGYAVRVERAGAGKTPPRRIFDAPDS